MPRCADCGFLSLRDPQSLHFMEVAEEGRLKWSFPSKGMGIGTTQEFVRVRVPIYYEVPFCAVGAMSIDQEAGGRLPEEVLPVIAKERTCEAFYKWKRCYSPKEHQDMWMTEEARRQASEQKEADRKWQESQAEKTRLWQEEQNRLNRSRQLWIALIVAAIGFIGVLIGKLL